MHIHLLGIGGIAMGNLAAMLKGLGHTVTGSDKKLYPPMSDKLRNWGIDVQEFSPKNLKGVELCIVGNAVSRGNSEVEALLNTGIHYMSMPQALAEFFLKGKTTIAVVGTHGKTSRSFLLNHVLHSAGLKNSFFAGGLGADGMDGFRLGQGSHFVIEGDEYDSAFFDKGPKFLHYRPRCLLLGPLEYDHADIYPDLQSYELAFRRLLQLIPSDGLIVADQGSISTRKILKGYRHSGVVWHSHSLKSSIFLKKEQKYFQIGRRRFDLSFIAEAHNFVLQGAHNRSNALAVTLMALHLGVPLSKIRTALESFPGVLRRQQVRFDRPGRAGRPPAIGRSAYSETAGGITFIEDFAHHPGALAVSLAAIRELYPKRCLHVFFEPRSATSHSNIFQERYTQCFRQADRSYLSEIFDVHKLPPQKRLKVRAIVATLNRKRKPSSPKIAYYGKDPQALLAEFQKHFQPTPTGDVILALSNGSFGGIYPQIEEFLKQKWKGG